MATITIPPCALEEMMDDNAEVVITSFCWNNHMRGNEPDIEFEVKVSQGYQYETDEVVLAEVYQELEDLHNQLKTNYELLVEELADAKETIVVLNKIRTELLATTTPKSKWAFWKK